MSSDKKMLSAALKVAEEVGVRAMTRQQVARRSGFCGSAVRYYFKTTPGLKAATYKHAVESWSIPVVAEGILSGAIRQAPPELCALICSAVMTAAHAEG